MAASWLMERPPPLLNISPVLGSVSSMLSLMPPRPGSRYWTSLPTPGSGKLALARLNTSVLTR